jgi:hypothetical protein
MEVSAGLGILRSFFEPARWIWRKLRFGPRVELELTWKMPPIWFIGSPIDKSMGIQITVTAPKHEEYVVANGAFQIQRRWRWEQICLIDEMVSLPWVIAANRSGSHTVSGSSIANWIANTVGESETARVRVSLADYHRHRVNSEPLTVNLAELRREEREA